MLVLVTLVRLQILAQQQISEMLDTNVLGTILMTQAVLPLLLKKVKVES